MIIPCWSSHGRRTRGGRGGDRHHNILPIIKIGIYRKTKMKKKDEKFSHAKVLPNSQASSLLTAIIARKG